jgi:hypothetical protein
MELLMKTRFASRIHLTATESDYVDNLQCKSRHLDVFAGILHLTPNFGWVSVARRGLSTALAVSASLDPSVA